VLAAAPVLTLAGCTAAVVVPAAPYASDPACGVVLQRAPLELVGLERRSTTSQSSRAWGTADPVVLRCGVEPPGPSTQRCIRVTDDAGAEVDWIAIEGETAWTFVTYGRAPAIEVVVPLSVQPEGTQATTPLVDLAAAVSVTSVERTCL
jgi:hypothetical protein